MSKDNLPRPKASLSTFLKLREQEVTRSPTQLPFANEELRPISEHNSNSKIDSSSLSGSSTPDSDDANKPAQNLSLITDIAKPKTIGSGLSSPNYSPSPNASPGNQENAASPHATMTSQLTGGSQSIFKSMASKRIPIENTLNTPNFLKEYRYRRKSSKTLIKEGENENKEIHQMSQPFLMRRSGRSSTSSQGTPSNYQNTPKAKEEKDQLTTEGKTPGGTKREEFPPHVGSCMISDSSDEEEELTPRRKELRKKIKKSLHVAYFLGILFSMKNRVKIYGALRSIEHVKQFEANKLEKKKHSFLPLLPTDSFTIVWTILLILLLILTALLTPYRVSFIEDDDPTFQVIDLIFDIWFGLDMLVSFLSAYFDPIQGLVTSFKLIALRYLKGWFWIDFIAILPFDDIIALITADSSSGSKVNKLLRLLRFPRLYRLLKILRLFKMLKIFAANQSINRTMKKLNLNIGIMKILRILVNILFLNHLVSCIWFYVARLEDFGPDTWVVRTGLLDSDAWSQYIASYYWAFQTLTTVGFGDLPPKTFGERIVSITWMIVGVGFYSFTIGNLSTILANIDKKSAVLKNKLTAFNNFAIKVKLPEFLRQKVQRFFELNHKENVYYWMDPQEMLKELPANLRTSLLLYSYYAMIKNIRLLQLDANFTASILTYLKLLKLKKSETLYREGDPAEEVYFISKGSVKLVNELGQSIYALTEGTYFGEVETLSEDKRISFCQATESTILLVCERESFLESLKDFPTIEMQIQRTAQTRKAKYQEKMAQLKEKGDTVRQEQGGKLMNSTEYFNNVIVKHFTKDKKPAADKKSEKKSKKSTTKIHIEPIGNSNLLPAQNSESTVFYSRDVAAEPSSPKAIRQPLETVNEEKLSATSPQKHKGLGREERTPPRYFGVLNSPKDEERGLLEDTTNVRSLNQNKDFVFSDPEKDEPFTLDADPISTWRRKRMEHKSPTFNPNANMDNPSGSVNAAVKLQKGFTGRRFLESQEEIEEEQDERNEKPSKNMIMFEEDEEKEQPRETKKVEEAPSASPELAKSKKFNNFFNPARKINLKKELVEVKEENMESLSFSLKASKLRLEESLTKDNISKVPSREPEEVSGIEVQDLNEEEKPKIKTKGGPQMKFDNLVKLMAQNLLEEDDNSEQESRVCDIEGEDEESDFGETFVNDL